MNKLDIQKSIMERVQELYEFGCKTYNVPVTKIDVRFDIRGLCAGMASSAGYVRFNMFIAENNLSEFMNDTVPHEVAHMVAYGVSRRTGKRLQPHGYEWQAICRKLGGNAKRCHSFQVEEKVKPHRYVCLKCGKVHDVSPRKSNSIQRAGVDRVRCSCGGNIEYRGMRI